MALGDIIGQDRARLLLQRALAESRLPHAYLFHGPAGVGKKFTAVQFVKALYCSTSSAHEACDVCIICRKIATDNHADVMRVGPDGNSIKIEQIRAIQHRLSYKPYEDQRTTILLEDCELLSPPAANALLKTLEEPRPNVLLLLLTGKKDALPLTIVSRCQLVPFRPLPSAHIRTILERQGIDPATAALAASLSEGQLDRLHRIELSQLLAMRQSAYSLLQDVFRAQGVSSFLQARKLASKREQCEELFRWLALLCRDLTMLTVAPNTPLYNQDLSADLATYARHLQLDHVLQMFEIIQQLRTYLTMNINPQLLFEQLVVQLQHIVAVPPPSAEVSQVSVRTPSPEFHARQ
jgi:DNA polymerase III subunit delta'